MSLSLPIIARLRFQLNLIIDDIIDGIVLAVFFIDWIVALNEPYDQLSVEICLNYIAIETVQELLYLLITSRVAGFEVRSGGAVT